MHNLKQTAEVTIVGSQPQHWFPLVFPALGLEGVLRAVYLGQGLVPGLNVIHHKEPLYLKCHWRPVEKHCSQVILDRWAFEMDLRRLLAVPGT